MTAGAMAKRVYYRLLGRRTGRSLVEIGLDTSTLLSYRLDPVGRNSASRLRAMRDRYRGRRCFILGNGPSLQAMDLSPLRTELTFGLNRAYLMFERIGFATTFLVAVNKLVVEQSGLEILNARTGTTFISFASRMLVGRSRRPIYLRSLARPQFSTDAARGVWEGATVTFVAMQIAFHLGIRDVVLLGVDHSFSTKGPPHRVVTSAGADPNHFDPAYFGTGYRWQLPDLETSEVAYRMARRAFEDSGGLIRDATVNGQLEIFPKVKFETLF
jgi:hypothetical protein